MSIPHTLSIYYNLLSQEIAGNFKKKGKKFRKDRRKTQSINWSNAKAMIHKFSDVQTQEEVSTNLMT